MRFLTAVILTISFAVAGANAAEPAKPGKHSRAKSFFRAVGSFSGGMILADPYQSVRPAKKKN